MTATTTPTMAPVSVDTIPLLLRTIPQWLVWKYETRDGDKPTKVPYSPLTTKHAAVNKPETWSTFNAAMQHRDTDPAQWGIGFVITPTTGLVGLDLDHCLDPFSGELEPWAQEIVTAIASYTEVSPSGEGLRIWTKGTLPPGRRRKGGLEMYDCGRYLTVTGAHVAETPAIIEERTDAVAAIHARFIAEPAPVAAPAPQSAPVAQPSMSDAKLLQKARSAKNGAQFAALYDHGQGTEDDSANDLSLCNFLAYWTGKDSARMDRLFRASKLYREKWDKRHSGDGRTYGAMTLQQAIADTVNVYDPQAYREAHAQRQPPAAYPGSDPTPGGESSNPLDSMPTPTLCVRNDVVRFVPGVQGGEMKKFDARRLTDIRDDMRAVVGEWPCRMGNLLFVHEGDDIRYLEKPGNLFAWMHERCEVSWRQGVGYNDLSFIKQEEFFAHLTATAKPYENIARLPHEPSMSGYYYAWEPLPDYVPTGEYLDTLVGFFANVETPGDAALIRAMFCTPMWGGTLGRRPIFALVAPDRGCGKSTLAEHVGTLYGGFLEFRAGQRAEDEFVSRVLTPSDQHKRVVRYDNIRGELASALVEGIITSPYISGKRMYTGEAVRPNDLTWVLTGNNLRLNGDFAQRCYIIRLVKPEYNPTWDHKIGEFIKQNRERIHADIILTLRRQGSTGKRYDRWPEWIDGVLRHCTDDGDGVIAVQEARRNDCNEDIEEARVILEELRTREGAYLELGWTFLGRKAVVSAVNDGLNTNKIGTKSALALMRQHIAAGHFKEGQADAVFEHKLHGERGFNVWRERQESLPE